MATIRGFEGTGLNGGGADPHEPAEQSNPPRLKADDSAGTDRSIVLYIHGSGSQPRASALKDELDKSLFGNPLGDRSRLAYFPHPRQEVPGERESLVSGGISTSAPQSREAIEEAVKEAARGLCGKLRSPEATTLLKIAREIIAKNADHKLPGLWYLLVQRFLPDLHALLFDSAYREHAERTVLDRLHVHKGQAVVIAHELGSVVAYNALRRLDSKGRNECIVSLLLTVGSPLGSPTLVEELRKRWKDLIIPLTVHTWYNVSDPNDPFFVRELKAVWKNVIDVIQPIDVPRASPHSFVAYLRSEPVQEYLSDHLGATFSQSVRRFRIAKDLAANAEDARPNQQHEVLIEYSLLDTNTSTSTIKEALEAVLREILEDQYDQRNIEYLSRFTAASLTRKEIETLAGRFHNVHLPLFCIWRNAGKRSLVWQSVKTVQALTARLGYGADGRGINWAVLDTGVDGRHPHFAQYKNIQGQWDCTQVGCKEVAPADADGHGTHVAGIIAGYFHGPLSVNGKGAYAFSGMAPETGIYSYKVLDDNGNGQDSYIMKALENIEDLNKHELVIHGINLSLGGDFDSSVYGCGHSPICRELRRLWRQGVLICIASGNEGIMTVNAVEGTLSVNRNLSIGDPANLEEAIAVGSIHKENPHTYGVSYFSSRGPTADGRFKPDVVAPGERILSARAGVQLSAAAETAAPAEDYYMERSGTSMAAPHVSGILAGFLSQRREFIGRPDETKRVLMQNCTDLGRERYFQGAGMPNLVKMLLQT